MLIPVNELVRNFDVRPNGVLHVGAHLAEESSMYEAQGWHGSSRIFWVESQDILVEKLKLNLDSEIHEVYCATAWDVSGVRMQFHHTNNSQSSSVLDLHEHKTKYPSIRVDRSYEVTTSRLDELFRPGQFDFIALDIQGAELHALLGLGELLKGVKWIYSEVNKVELYKNCALIQDLDNYLDSCGFVRVATRWAFRSGWGDALWIRQELVHHKLRRVVRTKSKNFWLFLKYSFRYIAGRLIPFRD